MAKSKRLTIGSVLKRKDDSGKYIKISRDVVLKAGTFLNLESKKEQLASLESAVDQGKLSGENADNARARIEKIPDFVLSEIILVQKE